MRRISFGKDSYTPRNDDRWTERPLRQRYEPVAPESPQEQQDAYRVELGKTRLEQLAE